MQSLVLMQEVQVEGQEGQRAKGKQKVIIEALGGGVGQVEEGLRVVVLLDDTLSCS